MTETIKTAAEKTGAPLVVFPFINQSLGNSSYLVGSQASGLAAVIDPERDVAKYVSAAEQSGFKIVYGLETHLHADFVSGVHELGAALKKAGNSEYQVAVSAEADAQFEHVALRDGDQLSLGDVRLHIIASPGHSWEHISFLAYLDGNEEPIALFSGGSLIVGGTGRPDLHGRAETEPLARALFGTINKFAQLHDELAVFPTHGAGSFCNTTTGTERTTTIGIERKTNPFFQIHDEEKFVKAATHELGNFPEYYKRLPALNREQARVLGGVPTMPALSVDEFKKQIAAGAVVLDVRDQDRYLDSHIPDSYGIPVFSPLSTWAGWVVPEGSAILLVADAPSELLEAELQLLRVGYDDLRGYLQGGMKSWQAANQPVKHVQNVRPAELKKQIEDKKAPPILDVRLLKEWNSGHLPDAKHLEAGLLLYASPNQIGAKDAPLLIHCKVGTRSTVAASLLERKGFSNLLVLSEGIEAWKQSGYAVVQDTKELAQA